MSKTRGGEKQPPFLLKEFIPFQTEGAISKTFLCDFSPTNDQWLDEIIYIVVYFLAQVTFIGSESQGINRIEIGRGFIAK